MITGKGVLAGNNVSHANNRTRRRFLPNVQDTSVFSEALGRKVRLTVSPAGLRTIDHKGGLDSWLLATASSRLDPDLRKLKDQVEKVQAAKSAA